jgi:hypothetical protein
MQSNTTTIGGAAKRSAWFGAKLALWVLGPLCILMWLAMTVGVIYKSATMGVSVSELLQSVVPDHPGSPTYFSMFTKTWLLCGAAVLYGASLSASAGAAVGATAKVIARRRNKG